MSRKCEDQIEERLEDRIQDIKTILESEDVFQKLREFTYGVSKTELYKLVLSGGGPSDHLTFEYDPEAEEVVGIKYHYLEWFDGAVRVIPTNSDEFKLLKQVFNLFVKIKH